MANTVARPLVWEETFSVRGDGERDSTGWEAPNGFNHWYRIDSYFGSDSLGFRVEFDHVQLGDFDDPDAARGCAQDHFEKMVRASLSSEQREKS